MSPTVAVVTVAYNSADTIGPFLASVGAALDRAGLAGSEIVVADASPDGQGSIGPEVVASGARHIALGRNLGYGGGIGAAVAALATRPAFLVVANPDIVVDVDSIAVLLDAAARLPRAGALGPRILDDDGGTYPSARSLPSLRTGVGHAVFGRVWPGNPWSRSYKSERELDRERAAGWLSGAFLVLRTDAWEAVGGFDDAYFMYFEDVDLGLRLGRAGWENVYVPTARVTHSGARSTSQNSRVMERVHHDSAYLYLSRKYHGAALAPLRLALRLGLAARSRWVTRQR